MTITALTLTNPGAEAGDTSGWTLQSGTGFTAVTTDGSITPHTGSYFFKGGNSASTFWDQQVDVSAYAAAIDAGTGAAQGIGWHNCIDDPGALYVECYDAAVALLSREENDQSQPLVWTEQGLFIALPVGTRYLRIGTHNVRTGGGNLNSDWDDFSLNISDARATDWPSIFGDALLSEQVAVYAWATQPAAQVRSSQVALYTWGAEQESSGLSELRSHQVAVYAWVRGYVEQPHVRAWTYSLDGHDHYVLRLGTLSTVVLDLTTGQWAEWSGHELPYWRAVKGINWLGMGPVTANRLYGTNIVAGDDRAGILWMLDPTQGIDDAPSDDLDAVPFTRAVTGIVPQVMRQTKPIGGVYITLSLGNPTVGASADVTLRTSDNWGQSYSTAGTVTIVAGDYTQEVAFRSLGLIRAPGKLFELSDEGAAIRINYADLR